MGGPNEWKSRSSLLLLLLLFLLLLLLLLLLCHRVQFGSNAIRTYSTQSERFLFCFVVLFCCVVDNQVAASLLFCSFCRDDDCFKPRSVRVSLSICCVRAKRDREKSMSSHLFLFALFLLFFFFFFFFFFFLQSQLFFSLFYYPP